ncbi:MAG: Inorganic pyrophosphatase [Rhodospirillales bacterium]|nr:Inorganic pyrophosphatase [Rhodospirillales bacterium]
MTQRDLSRMPLKLEGGDVHIVIETTMGSFNKYNYNPELDAFELKDVLPRGSAYPFDFGFFPSTLSEAGDPIDALVLSDQGLDVGIVLKGRLIGVLEFSDSEDGEITRNDRLIAVPVCSVMYMQVKTAGDLPPALLDQLEAFFVHDAAFKGKRRRLLRRGNAKRAEKLLAKGSAAFNKTG